MPLSNYPDQYDAFSDPESTSFLASPDHAVLHVKLNDSIEAIQAELGLLPSGSDATVGDKLTRIDASHIEKASTITNAVTYRVATSNVAGPSSADELRNADLTLTGTGDVTALNSFISTTSSGNANKYIRILFTGQIIINSPINIPSGSWLMIESAYPHSGIWGEEPAQIKVNSATFTTDDFLFKASGSNVRLSLKGIRVFASGASGAYKLSNCRQTIIDHCSAIGTDQVYLPQTGSAIFKAFNSYFNGSTSNALLVAGWGSGGSGSTPTDLVIQNSQFVNDTGPIIKWDNCANINIINNRFSSVGSTAALLFRQNITDSGATWTTRPPAYSQHIVNNRILTAPTTAAASPTAAPFLSLNNIRGAIISGNICSFDSLYSGSYRSSTGTFISLANYCQHNNIVNNLFMQASGAVFDNSDMTTDGSYVSARIALDNTCDDNTIRNSQQLLTDNGTGNDYPIDSYMFSRSSFFVVGESPRWPVRKQSILFEAYGTLGLAGSSDTVVDITVNGATAATLTFANGEEDATATFEYSVQKNDFITINITTVGGSPSDLAIAIRGYS